MKTNFPDLACAQCGSNRFMFPKSVDEVLKCEDCGTSGGSLEELEARIVKGVHPKESRKQRLERHAREVAESHEQLRASVSQTDRLIVASNEMIRRHRKEDDEAGK